MSKLPYFKFFASDWLGDSILRTCGHAVRGVWIDMLCLMAQAPERGVLAWGSRPWSDEEIVAAVGGDPEVVRAALAELLNKNIARRNEHGAVFSGRIVRDEMLRQTRSEVGRIGGQTTQRGQANLKQTAKQSSEQPLNPIFQSPEPEPYSDSRPINPPNPPSGGTRPGKASRPVATPDDPPIPPELDTPLFREAWGEWLADRKDRRKALTLRGARQQLATCKPWGPDRAVSAIEHSIASGYQGIFEGNDHARTGRNRTAPAATGDSTDLRANSARANLGVAERILARQAGQVVGAATGDGGSA